MLFFQPFVKRGRKKKGRSDIPYGAAKAQVNQLISVALHRANSCMIAKRMPPDNDTPDYFATIHFL